MSFARNLKIRNARIAPESSYFVRIDCCEVFLDWFCVCDGFEVLVDRQVNDFDFFKDGFYVFFFRIANNGRVAFNSLIYALYCIIL